MNRGEIKVDHCYSMTPVGADAVAGSAKIAAANNAEKPLVIFMTATSVDTR